MKPSMRAHVLSLPSNCMSNMSPRHVLKHFGILIYSRSEIDEINKGQKPGWLMIYLFILMQTWRGLALVFSMGPSLSCRNPSISWWCFIKAHFWWYKNQLIRNINPFVYIRWFHWLLITMQNESPVSCSFSSFIDTHRMYSTNINIGFGKHKKCCQLSCRWFLFNPSLPNRSRNLFFCPRPRLHLPSTVL